MDQRIIKIMTMRKALHPRDDVDRCQEKKKEEDPQTLKIASMLLYKKKNDHFEITEEDWLEPPETTQTTQASTEQTCCPVGWGCRIHQLHLCRGVRSPKECSIYDTKQSHGEVPVMLELWRLQSTPLLPLLPGPRWPGVVAPDKGPIYGLNRTKGILMLNWIVWLNWIAWNRNVFDN